MNQQLLLYILDLLAAFASKSDENLMTVSNLSSIFQPGILSHPEHDMSPKEYYLSQNVVIFLISHQKHFSINTITSNSNLILLDDSENNNFLEASYATDSSKYAFKKKSNVLKKPLCTNPKFQNSCKNNDLKLEEFNSKKPFQFISRSNTLPSNSSRRINPCITNTLVSLKQNTLKSSKFSPRKLSINEDKIFKMKR